MTNTTLLLSTIKSVLGEGKPTSKNNYSFKCPNGCYPSKYKLEINLDTQQYHCWICDMKGKSVLSLFKKINVSKDKIDELLLILPKNNNNPNNIVVKNIEEINLPKEFKSLNNINDNSFSKKKALSYLRSRGINELDIIKYNLGYCEEGPYKDRIIIPSYDKNGKLNYFTSRTFDKNNPIKYKNPSFSRDIIPFELFINWELPIILCEGPLDAIAIKRNVIPLMGKNIQPSLMKKIVTSSVKKIYIALDNDAIKQALNFCEQLLNEGKEIYLVETDKKDPNELGFVEFTKIIQNTYELKFSDLIEKKLNTI